MIKNFDIKKFYAAAWIFLTLAAFVTLLTGNFNALMLVAFSLTALGLVYALALWTVIGNTSKTAG